MVLLLPCGKLIHPGGLRATSAKSTLAYANAHRPRLLRSGLSMTLISSGNGMNPVFFLVTRLKVKATYKTVKQYPVPSQGNVLFGQTMPFTGPQTRFEYHRELRRIMLRDEENKRKVELLTNLRRFSQKV
jgi:hypothetical protein